MTTSVAIAINDHGRHAGDPRAGHVEPGLRDLVGADLMAAGPKAVEAAEDRERAERHDDRRHAAERHDETVDQPAAEPDGAGDRDAGQDRSCPGCRCMKLAAP